MAGGSTITGRWCYWCVADGDYVQMAQTAIKSARRVGVREDFHVWAERPVMGAEVHPLVSLDKSLYRFKLEYLRRYVAILPYEYFVWLDADNYFVRNPGNVLQVLQGSPVHATLESDACSSQNRRPDWWGCPLSQYVELMRACGVRSRSIYNINAGFWVVHRDAIETFCSLAFEFWAAAAARGYTFTEEAPIAYAVQMLCGDPFRHTLQNSYDLWASDWKGHFSGRLPVDEQWWFEDYFSGDKRLVNPAIVHAMRSKSSLVSSASISPLLGP